MAVPPNTKIGEMKLRLVDPETWPPALRLCNFNGVSDCPSSASSAAHSHHHAAEDDEEDDASDLEEEDDDDDDENATVDTSRARHAPPDVSRLRLVCMGQGLLHDGRTLAGRYGGEGKNDRRRRRRKKKSEQDSTTHPPTYPSLHPHRLPHPVLPHARHAHQRLGPALAAAAAP